MSAQSHDLKAPRPNSHGVLLFLGTVARRSFDREYSFDWRTVSAKLLNPTSSVAVSYDATNP